MIKKSLSSDAHSDAHSLFKKYFLKEELPSDNLGLQREFSLRISQLTKEDKVAECKELQQIFRTSIQPFFDQFFNR